VKSVVTSHLSVTMSTSDAGTVTTGFAGTGKSGKTDSPLGAFAAILNALEAAATTAASGNLLGAVTNLVNAGSTAAQASPNASSVDAPSTTASATPASDATVTTPLANVDATAATTIADPGAATAIQPKLLGELVDSLTALDKAQSSGQPVADDLLKRVKKAVDALSGFLATQQSVTPPTATTTASAGALPAAAPTSDASPATPIVAPTINPTPATGGATDSAAATGSPADSSAQLAPLAHKIEDFAAALAQTQPDLSTKLNALAQNLGSGQLSTDILTALGLNGGNAPPDPKLAVAINGLINGKQTSPTSLQPKLAAPSLKLPTDSAFAVGTADSKAKNNGLGGNAIATVAKPAAAPSATPTTAGDNSAHNGKDDNKPAETVAAAVAQATGSQAPDPSTASASGAPGVASATATTPTVTAQAATAAYQAATTPVNLPQMAFDIVRHMQQGSNQFQIRLDPADMGRIDVKLDIGSTGNVNAHLTVEHPETLDLLKRDSGALGAALSQAGLDSSKTNLEFSLRQNPFANQNGNGGNNGNAYAGAAADDTSADEPVAAIGASTLYRGSLTSSGLNIFV
jgi:flagellar hook-length control protein FliK